MVFHHKIRNGFYHRLLEDVLTLWYKRNPGKKVFISIKAFPYDESRLSRRFNTNNMDGGKPTIIKDNIRSNDIETEIKNKYKEEVSTTGSINVPLKQNNNYIESTKTLEEKEATFINGPKIKNIFKTKKIVKEINKIKVEVEEVYDTKVMEEIAFNIETFDEFPITVDVIKVQQPFILSHDLYLHTPPNTTIFTNYNEVKSTLDEELLLDLITDTDLVIVNKNITEAMPTSDEIQNLKIQLRNLKADMESKQIERNVFCHRCHSEMSKHKTIIDEDVFQYDDDDDDDDVNDDIFNDYD